MPMPEISKMLTVSSAHICNSTAAALDLEGVTDSLGLAVYEKDDFGWIIYPVIMKNESQYKHDENGDILFGHADNMPKDLQNLLRYCHDLGCQILCIDSDGPIIPYLPTYDND